MKILFISHILPYPPVSGAQQRTFHILKQAARNNDVYLLALCPTAITPNQRSLTAGTAALREFCREVVTFRLPSDRSRLAWNLQLLLNLFSLAPYSVRKLHSNELHKEIVRQLNTRQFDLIHVETIDLAQYIAVHPGIKRVINHHNVESELLTRRSIGVGNILAKWYMYLQGIKLQKYEEKNMPAFDLNLACSYRDAGLLEAIADGARYEVIPNGTDTSYFSPRKGKPYKELVFAGPLDWYPNLEAIRYFLKEIYPLIKRREPEVAINIIGRSPSKDLRQFAHKDPSIRVHGFVDDIRGLVARSAAYVAPIRFGSGTRLKILDAFACGKALVADPIACEGIDVTAERDILIGDSPETFANQVVRILTDDRLRESLEQNARNLVLQKYSWDVIGKQLENAYRSVVL